MTLSSRNVLILADLRREMANTVRDHIDAFRKYSRHSIHYFDPTSLRTSYFLNLADYDAVVIHYSLAIFHEWYLHESFQAKIRAFQRLKVLYIQDDYRHINAVCEVVRSLGIQVLFTLYHEDRIHRVWTPDRVPQVKIFSTLAGYIPEYLENCPSPPLRDRPIDVGYRGRALPYWLGELGQEKRLIADRFNEHARHTSLVHDVSHKEEDRIYGDRWPQFITSCKAMLGTESGSSITDFDSQVENLTQQYLKAHPGARFEEVQTAVLHPFENNVRHNVISPRHLECAALRTALVLFPGEYSGILKPWEHYLPLAKDFSNFAEVAHCLRDLPMLEAMTERAHRDLVASGKLAYRVMVQQFDRVIDEANAGRSPSGTASAAVQRWKRPFQPAEARVANHAVLLALQLFSRLEKGSHLAYFLATLLACKWTREVLWRYLRNSAGVPWKVLVKELILLKHLRGRCLQAAPASSPALPLPCVSLPQTPARTLRIEMVEASELSPADAFAQELLENIGQALASGQVQAIEFFAGKDLQSYEVESRFNRRFRFALTPDLFYRFSAITQLFLAK